MTGAGREPRERRCPVASVVSVVSVALVVGALVAGCGSSPSSDEARPAPASGSLPAVTVTVPALPSGVEDCGESNALSGWPTTTIMAPGQPSIACIVDAFAAGTPARLVIIEAGTSSSGLRTSDGYDIPARRITIWTVTGPSELEVVTDFSADGGKRTTRTCSQLPPVDTGWPEPGGCSP